MGAAERESSIHPHLLDSGAPWLGPNTPLGPSSALGRVRPGVLGYCTPTDAEGERSTDSFRAGVGMSECRAPPTASRGQASALQRHPSSQGPRAAENLELASPEARGSWTWGPSPPHQGPASRPDARAFSSCYGATSSLPPSPTCQVGSRQALGDREEQHPRCVATASPPASVQYPLCPRPPVPSPRLTEPGEG